MTETEWLACEDPHAMLMAVRDRANDRLSRLVAAGLCRLRWHRISDWRCRRAVEIAELTADGLATQDQLTEAREAIRSERKYGMTALAKGATQLNAFHAALRVLHLLRLMARRSVGCDAEARLAADRFFPNEAALLRDIFGNPFRTLASDPDWLTSTVVALARGIYDERAFDRLPILADALQDAGCENEDALAHCRGPGPHARGCWVVDLVLGKS